MLLSHALRTHNRLDTKLLNLREIIVMRHDILLMIKFSVAIVRALGHQIVLVQILSIPA